MLEVRQNGPNLALQHAVADAFNCAPPSLHRQCSLCSLSTASDAPSIKRLEKTVMDHCRPAPKHSSMPTPTAEKEITTGTSNAASATESELVHLLSQSRREADSLRQELAAVRKKADADHRRLQSFIEAPSNSASVKSAEIQVRAFQERLAHAEAALEDAETRSGMLERNWLQLDNYLSVVQHQASASRAAFSRIMEQSHGTLTLSTESLPAMRREIPSGDYFSSRNSMDRSMPTFTHPRHHSLSPSSSLRGQDLIRPPPLLLPRHAEPSRLPPLSDIDDERWRGRESLDAPPPYKRQRGSRRESEASVIFRPPSPRSYSPPVHRRPSSAASPSHPSTLPIPRKRSRSRHPSREYMPPPPAPPVPRLRHETDSRPVHHVSDFGRIPVPVPPLQIIQHRHPTPPALPPPPPPPPPPPVPESGDVPHQYQHRFHLGTGTYVPRRLVRPGAYETVVFALDPGEQAHGGGRGRE
ncbi:hypothetical protein C8R43DRAFT_1043594 [Mycena crocata]|nr:hypothetical protein C8R43DRAFT_1043594 [Mycena crocata]